MTHLLIGWRAGDLIVINGRGPAWPAPQRSVVLPSSVLQDHPAFQGPGNGWSLPTRKCQPATQFIDNFKTSPLDTLVAVLSQKALLLHWQSRSYATLSFERVVDAFSLGIDGANFQPIDRGQGVHVRAFTSAKGLFVPGLLLRFETPDGDCQSGYRC